MAEQAEEVIYGDGLGEVCPRRHVGPADERPMYGIVQVVTDWSDVEKKLKTRVFCQEHPFRNDDAGRMEAYGEHLWAIGAYQPVACTTLLRELSPTGPGTVIEAWQHPLPTGEI